MTDNKYTDDQIIMALKCCEDRLCGDCVRLTDSSYPQEDACRLNTISLAIALINRQKSEIDRLQTEKDNLIKTYAECQKAVILDFKDRMYQKMGKHTSILHKEYVQRIIREIIKEMTEENK